MNLQLNPKFHRGHVWTEEQQIAWLEFFLRGGNSGKLIYFNCPSWHYPVKDVAYNDYVCVDGLQRLTAIPGTASITLSQTFKWSLYFCKRGWKL